MGINFPKPDSEKMELINRFLEKGRERLAGAIAVAEQRKSERDELEKIKEDIKKKIMNIEE